MMESMPKSKVLDLGCSGGLLAEKLRQNGHYVVGVDRAEVDGVRERTDQFHVADLNAGISSEWGSGYDVVIAGDVIEHLADPLGALRAIKDILRPGGQLLLSVPNFGHWYPRVRIATGFFGYDRRGILDSTHLRFFTRANLRRLTRAAGFDVLEETATGLPLGVITSDRGAVNTVRRIDQTLVNLRPTLFGYQYLLRLTPHAEEMVWSDHLIEGHEGPEGDPESSRQLPEAAEVR
jgi:SAM-dependent methyltransferase